MKIGNSIRILCNKSVLCHKLSLSLHSLSDALSHKWPTFFQHPTSSDVLSATYIYPFKFMLMILDKFLYI